jgi:hypothetical protein
MKRPEKRSKEAEIGEGFVLGGAMIHRDLRQAYLFTKANTHGFPDHRGRRGWKAQYVDAAGTRLEQHDRVIELTLYPHC